MKKLNMMIALASFTLLSGGVHAMQAKQTNYTISSLYNSVVESSVQQNSKEPLKLAKGQRCESDNDTGIVRCSTTS